MALVSSPDFTRHINCLVYNPFFPVCNTKTESMLESGVETRKCMTVVHLLVMAFKNLKFPVGKLDTYKQN